jgi:uncharacterized membrane protein
MINEYSRGHMIRIGALNMIVFLVGLMTVLTPFIGGMYPGDLQTTDHVALGALICVLSIFRATLGFGSIWIDVCLFFLGLITFCMPRIMSMRWDDHYNSTHLMHGGIIMAIAVISIILTVPNLPSRRRRI